MDKWVVQYLHRNAWLFKTKVKCSSITSHALYPLNPGEAGSRGRDATSDGADETRGNHSYPPIANRLPARVWRSCQRTYQCRHQFLLPAIVQSKCFRPMNFPISSLLLVQNKCLYKPVNCCFILVLKLSQQTYQHRFINSFFLLWLKVKTVVQRTYQRHH